MPSTLQSAVRSNHNPRPALPQSLAFLLHGDEMSSLYEIATSYRADVARLADLDLPAEVITDTLDAMSGELEVKA